MSDGTVEEKRIKEMKEQLKDNHGRSEVTSPLPPEGKVSSPTFPSKPTGEPRKVQCKKCVAEQEVPAGAKEFTCKVCGEKNVISSS